MSRLRLSRYTEETSDLTRTLGNVNNVASAGQWREETGATFTREYQSNARAETLKLADQEIVFSVDSAKHCKAGLGSEDQVY